MKTLLAFLMIGVWTSVSLAANEEAPYRVKVFVCAGGMDIFWNSAQNFELFHHQESVSTAHHWDFTKADSEINFEDGSVYKTSEGFFIKAYGKLWTTDGRKLACHQIVDQL